MKLAVTDQEAFEQAKAKKKHKKGWNKFIIIYIFWLILSILN